MSQNLQEVFPTSVHRLAVELQDCANGGGPQNWRILPYQHTDSENTTWWIKRGTSNPAYRDYKAIVRPAIEPDDPGVLWIGTNAEKGLGADFKEIARTTKEKNFLMDGSWAWPRFETALRTGKFGGISDHVRDLGLELRLTVSVGIVSITRGMSEGFKENIPKVRATFLVRGGSLERVGPKEHDPRLPGSAEISAATSWGSLVQAIAPAVEHSWTWIDVYLYARFSPGREGAEWNAGRLWKELLTPLIQAVR